MSNFYGSSWDTYVRQFRQSSTTQAAYPGDEWGWPQWWEQTYQRLFAAAGADQWKHVVEIGPGSGKYTHLLLDRSPARILAVDVSQEFLSICTEREQSHVASGRLIPHLLPCRHPAELYHQIASLGWVRQLDAMVSIDAMVHVDLQYLVAYFVTAAATLAKGGHLILTLADATSQMGQQKLLDDIKTYYPMQGVPSLKFEFLSPDLITATLARLGFEITKLEWDFPDPAQSRDIFLIAQLRDMSRAESATQYLDIPSLPADPR